MTVKAIISYCYTEKIKLIHSVFFFVAILFFVVISFLLLFAFKTNIYENYTIQLISIPETKFEHYFMSALSVRVQYLSFFMLLALSLMSIEFDFQTGFLPEGVRTTPVNVVQFILAKTTVILGSSAVFVASLLAIITVAIAGTYDEYVITFDSRININLVMTWMRFVAFGFPTILLLLALSLAIGHRPFVTFIVANLIYLVSCRYSLYPIAGFSNVVIDQDATLQAFDFLVVFACSAIFVGVIPYILK
jgi:hypothetical protein